MAVVTSHINTATHDFTGTTLTLKMRWWCPPQTGQILCGALELLVDFRARHKDRRDFCVHFRRFNPSSFHAFTHASALRRSFFESHVLRSTAPHFLLCACEGLHTRMRQVQIVHDVNRNASTVATIDETSHINHINFADAVRTVSWKLMFSLCSCF